MAEPGPGHIVWRSAAFWLPDAGVDVGENAVELGLVEEIQRLPHREHVADQLVVPLAFGPVRRFVGARIEGPEDPLAVQAGLGFVVGGADRKGPSDELRPDPPRPFPKLIDGRFGRSSLDQRPESKVPSRERGGGYGLPVGFHPHGGAELDDVQPPMGPGGRTVVPEAPAEQGPNVPYSGILGGFRVFVPVSSVAPELSRPHGQEPPVGEPPDRPFRARPREARVPGVDVMKRLAEPHSRRDGFVYGSDAPLARLRGTS